MIRFILITLWTMTHSRMNCMTLRVGQERERTINCHRKKQLCFFFVQCSLLRGRLNGKKRKTSGLSPDSLEHADGSLSCLSNLSGTSRKQRKAKTKHDQQTVCEWSQPRRYRCPINTVRLSCRSFNSHSASLSGLALHGNKNKLECCDSFKMCYTSDRYTTLTRKWSSTELPLKHKGPEMASRSSTFYQMTWRNDEVTPITAKARHNESQYDAKNWFIISDNSL